MRVICRPPSVRRFQTRRLLALLAIACLLCTAAPAVLPPWQASALSTAWT